jgi:uncharacterized protein (TIGR02145 family)
MAKMLSKPKYWSSYTNNSFTPGYWQTDSTGFNTTDFSLLPTGYIYYADRWASDYGTYCGDYSTHYHYYYLRSGLTTDAYFWTSSANKYRQINYAETGIYYSTTSLTSAFSVRCVKDY